MSSIALTGFELIGTDGEQPTRGGWIPAVVPGGVHESLMAAGQIEHPFFADVRAVEWIEDKTWWYRTSFPGERHLASNERVRLVFRSLDTVASVWLNGELLGQHCNQHRPAIFDVSKMLRGENEILIKFAPHLAHLEVPEVTNRQRIGLIAQVMRGQGFDNASIEAFLAAPAEHKYAHTALRKAACSWGWDFGARMPSVGIIAPVELVRERVASIGSCHVRATRVDVQNSTATLAVDVDIDTFAGTPDAVRVVIIHPSGREETVNAEFAGPTASLEHEIKAAELWWSHDLGAQPLYSVRVELLGDGEVLDSATTRTGLRTVEWDQSEDPEGGTYFRLKLNGVPTFCRGANWVPASLMVGSVSDKRYRDLVSAAKRGEMNMIRMWGGGIYEPEAFYEACDELGVLVWQDFMFACDAYPEDLPGFIDEVALEADVQIKRLRNHASIVIWAGNNEIHLIHGAFLGPLDPMPWGGQIFDALLPELTGRLAPEIPYWPSSPWGPNTGVPFPDPDGAFGEASREGVWEMNGVTNGDRHAWEVWHGSGGEFTGESDDWATPGDKVHWHRYAADKGKFISEFGIQGLPELGTLERWNLPGSIDIASAAFHARINDNPKNKAFTLLEHEVGIPTTMEQYVDYSMLCQAEGMKFGVEHFRRRQPHCSGTLVWQFNDVWPGVSWSLVDYDLVPKAAYYYLQRANATVLASFKATEDEVELWVTNSGRRDIGLDLLVEVAPFDGAATTQDKVTLTSAGYSSQKVWSGPRPGGQEYAWVSELNGLIEPNRLFFDKIKHLPLASSSLVTTIEPVGADSAKVTISSNGYSYLTRVLTPHPGVVIDQNYFDLRDGEQEVVTVTGLEPGFDVQQLQVRAFIG